MRSGAKSRIDERFGYRVVLLARRWRQLADTVLESHGLSDATWRPLLYLVNFHEAPRQCELADSLAIGGPALVRLIDNLEKKKLVQRVDVDTDRRSKRIRLTPAGRKIARRVQDIIETLEGQLMKGITLGDIAHCDRVFDSVQLQIVASTPPRAGIPGKRA